MPATTFTAIGQNAFALLNVFLPGEAMPNADANYARGVANRMLSGWGQRGNLFSPFVGRERFALVANKGGLSNPYTIGPGGDFDTDKPENQNSITSANLILTVTTPNVRVPLGLYTDQAYDANQIPDLSNGQPTGLYYNPTYTGGLGSIYLWPVPNVATNALELFIQKSIASFANLNTTYYLPDGVEDTITYQLALRLQGAYGKKLDPEDVRIAAEVLGVFKRSNAKMSDLSNDAMFAMYNRSGYNIQTGE